MNHRDTILIPLVAFIFTYFILYIILPRVFPKFKSLKLQFKLAFLAGLSHFILITILCIFVANLIKHEPEAGMMFYLAYFFDFIFFACAGWLYGVLFSILSYNAANVVAPFIAFGILGSLTYAFLGLVIGRIVEMTKGVK